MTSCRTVVQVRRSPAARRLPATFIHAALVFVAALLASGHANVHASARVAEDRVERARALTELGVRYEHAEGREQDLDRAHDLYCTAARAGHPDALIRLGWMYANGRGVPRDDSHANTLFRRAEELGSELGGRLATTIRGVRQSLPACMTAGVPSAAAPADDLEADEGNSARVADGGPTPVVASPARFRAAPDSAEHRELVGTVVRLAREFRLDPRLVFALIRVESGFDPMARSARNAQGLMQLLPETAERFAVANVWDTVDNLRGGMSYLRWLLSYFRGDVVLTLAAYNAGERTVDRYRGVPPFSETVAYVQRIRAIYPFDRHAFDPKVAALNPLPEPRRLARATAP